MNTRSRRAIKRVPSIFDEDYIRDEEDDDSDEFEPSPPKRRKSNQKVRKVSTSSESSEDKASKPSVTIGCNLSDSSESESDEQNSNVQKEISGCNVDSTSLINGTEESQEAVTQSEYYDFSDIIKNQDLIKQCQNVAKNGETKAPYEFKETPSQSDTSSKSDNKRKKRQPREKKAVKRENKVLNDVKTTEDETLEISELLAIGETAKVKEECDSDAGDANDATENQTPKNVEVKIEMPDIFSWRRKKRKDMEDAIKRQLRAVRRENQVYYHKVSLLCLLSHGNFVNSILSSEDVLGLALSIVPSENFYPPKLATLEYLEKLVTWFSKKIKVDLHESKLSLLDCLREQFAGRVAWNNKFKVFMFVSVVRVLGLQCRLMMNLQPMPLRPPHDPALSSSSKKKDASEANSDSEVSSDEDLTVVPVAGTSKSTKKTSAVDSKNFSIENSNKTPKKSTKTPQKSSKTPQKDTKKDVNEKKSVAKSSKNKKVLDRRVLSSEDDLIEMKKKTGKTDVWAEVFLENEEKWISVDVIKNKVHCINHLYSMSTHPVSYILGWNGDMKIKDLTCRYAPHWMTTTQKLRIDSSWWKKSLRPWKPKLTAREKEENLELDKILSDQPMPSTIGEFKNHPLYVLPRHLLKFEAIYPSDAPPLGFIKKEPIYSRLCVFQLHSRETWMRQAKTVRLNEKPYKIVKARPKWDKLAGKIVSDLPLDLFGHWQVEDYMPPVAQNGKVPRNEYGNVELYKPSMLPIGTVHLQIPGVMRVTRKLGIDCAPALVGWEYSGGASFPVMDGFVICEEFKEKVLDLWAKEVDESAKKEKQKNKQRIYDNWKKLIKGLIIRERLEKRYNFQPSDIAANKKPKGTSIKSNKKKS